jgi:hypothetical protein
MGNKHDKIILNERKEQKYYKQDILDNLYCTTGLDYIIREILSGLFHDTVFIVNAYRNGYLLQSGRYFTVYLYTENKEYILDNIDVVFFRNKIITIPNGRNCNNIPNEEDIVKIKINDLADKEIYSNTFYSNNKLTEKLLKSYKELLIAQQKIAALEDKLNVLIEMVDKLQD